MKTLTFTDPRVVAAYWDRFEDRAIGPVQPYLWTYPEGVVLDPDDSDSPTITPIRRSELDLMVIDESRELIKFDSAVYVHGQRTDGTRNILIFGHKDRDDDAPGWDLEVLLYLQNKIEAENLLKQLAGEIARVFSD